MLASLPREVMSHQFETFPPRPTPDAVQVLKTPDRLAVASNANVVDGETHPDVDERGVSVVDDFRIVHRLTPSRVASARLINARQHSQT